MMKFSLILIFGLILTIQSCKEEQSTFDVTRIIKNETDHILLITVYDEGDISESILIGAMDADTADEKCGTERGRIAFCDLVWGRERDSVSIFFGEEKYLTYCSEKWGCLINDKNILGLNVLTDNQEGYVEFSDNVYVFSITQEEYDIAEPIRD